MGTSKDKPSVSDTNIRNEVFGSGLSHFHFFWECIISEFSARDSRSRLSNTGLLQSPVHWLRVQRESEWRILLRRGSVLPDVPHVCGRGHWDLQEILVFVSKRYNIQPGEARMRCLVQC